MIIIRLLIVVTVSLFVFLGLDKAAGRSSEAPTARTVASIGVLLDLETSIRSPDRMADGRST